MPRRGPEPRPLIRTLAALLLLALAPPLAAQAAAGRGLVEAELALTRLAGGWAPLGGAALAVTLPGGLEVGGAGRVALRRPALPQGGRGLRLRFGYAGVRAAARPERWPGVRVSLLAGAGNVDVRDPAGDVELDSDNGAVLEPALAWTAELGPRLTILLSASYRLAFGFEALGDVSAEDLRGPAAALGLRVGPF